MAKLHLLYMPGSPIDRLAYRLRPLIRFETDAFYALMGTVAGNMMEGVPVWLSLIGPPGCGKTELIRSLLHIPQTVECICPTNEAAFLSATPAREKAGDATGGLLRQINKHGLLLVNDLTSLLSLKTDQMTAIMAVFREAYSGSWIRSVGAEGGRTLQWQGRLGVITGCTNALDHHHAIFSSMGERWINYRFPEQDSRALAMAAMDENRPKDWQKQMRDMVRDFFDELVLACDGEPTPRRPLTEEEKSHLHNLADLSARCRSAVSRDYRTKERLDSRQTETCTRLTLTLGQLLIGMDYIGVPAPTAWRIVDKIALDCIPGPRLQVLQTLLEKPHSTGEASQRTGLCLGVTKRNIEDLKVQEIITRTNGRWHPQKWVAENRRDFREFQQSLCRPHLPLGTASD